MGDGGGEGWEVVVGGGGNVYLPNWPRLCKVFKLGQTGRDDIWTWSCVTGGVHMVHRGYWLLRRYLTLALQLSLLTIGATPRICSEFVAGRVQKIAKFQGKNPIFNEHPVSCLHLTFLGF